MREIRFRAWNVATNTMVDLHKITPLALDIETDGLFIPFSDGLLLMQYTGLKDKNGVEIWEGDIVEDVIGKGQVIFKAEEYSMFIMRYKLDEKVNDVIVIGRMVEVIGNIYENPELIQKGN